MAVINDVTVLASGLRFPEGPVALADTSILFVEIRRRTLSRLTPDGTVEVVAEPGGGPNGAAIGPDGACYLANDGGCFSWLDVAGLCLPGPLPEDYSGGRIERVDLDTGDVKVLYTECDGHKLIGPNDIVFDADGGMWFTDHARREGRVQHLGAIYYAQPDGSSINEVVFPSESPNGIGLSPDGSRLYAAETHTGRVYAWNITAPGEVERIGDAPAGQLLCGLPGMQLFDSLGVDGDGNVVVATLVTGALTVIAPTGEVLDQVMTGDPMTTNVCWGGDDLRTAYVTCSGTGRLISLPWPRPGLPLNFLNR